MNVLGKGYGEYSSAVELDRSSLLVARDQDDRRSIGDMSEDEVLEYFEESLTNKYKTTRDFIIFYVGINPGKYEKITKKYPEYFI
jgi:hypothetical protein